MTEQNRDEVRNQMQEFLEGEGILPGDVEEEEQDSRWNTVARSHPITVELGGRSRAVTVEEGQPFVETLVEIADQHNYGGNYRVYLNGEQILEPEDAPAVFEPGMRVAIEPHDKTG